jgi:SAM-dependent methyltransferase
MKWLQESSTDENINERLWSTIHNEGYNIWSVSSDVKLLSNLSTKINALPHKNILIIGCGSNVDLQNMLATKFNDIEQLICSDFDDVISIAQSKPNAPIIQYSAVDSRSIGYNDYFDIVISINSILSSHDYENRQILLECNKALKPSGTFIGLFPTVICTQEIDALEKRYNKYKRPFLENHIFSDIIGAMVVGKQLYYSPIILRRILHEASYADIAMELVFFDSDESKAQAYKYYAVQDNDIVVYEILVTAQKVIQLCHREKTKVESP